MEERIKKYLLGLLTLYISLYIPLAITAYSSAWYSLATNSTIQSYLGTETVEIAHTNLTQFFLHQKDLYTDFWSDKEIRHMHEVRIIYDILFLIGALAAICIAINIWKQKCSFNKKTGYINLLVIGILSLLLPIFPFFWSHIFHAALFRNDLWLMLPEDLSYHLFPLSFFIKSFSAIIITGFLINVLSIWICGKISQRIPSK